MQRIVDFDHGIITPTKPIKPIKPKKKSKQTLYQAVNELNQWYKVYDGLKKSNDAHFEKSLRDIRLKNLFKKIKTSLATGNRKPKRHIKKTPEQLYQDRIVYSRVRGNEFTRDNKFRLIYDNQMPPVKYVSMDDNRSSRLSFGRKYGNSVSMKNRTGLIRTPSFYSSKSISSTLVRQVPEVNPSVVSLRKRAYGQYYSMRNRLKQKDINREFDMEYHSLLLKCITFEKDHLEVYGFLEEKFRSKPHLLSSLMATANKNPAAITATLDKATNARLLASCESEMAEKVIRAQNLEEKFHDAIDEKTEEVLLSLTTISKIPNCNDANFHDLSEEENGIPTIYENSSESEIKTSSSETVEQISDLDSPHQRFQFVGTSKLLRENGDQRLTALQDSAMDLVRTWRASGKQKTLDDLIIDIYMLMFQNLFQNSIQCDSVGKPRMNIEKMKDALAEQTSVLSNVLKDVFYEQ